ncbi:MAG: ornithine cyclodeaminase family protein [Acidobacteriota bacterium]|nr:ornithine cyclodeaminase family protein [Acidobacteriota bacterium]MDH3524376.1 ornithine cyclodeaminase family protein [Acidobacteriota bacterium]
MKLYRLPEIRPALAGIDLVELMGRAFAAYSAGRAVVAPVGELLLAGGDVHVKSGYLEGGDYYVVKIASGFYGNPSLGLPSSNGVMLLFFQKTGELAAVLHDEGHLTDVRTAAAGAVAARHLAGHPIERIAIFGTGTQARLQLAHLRAVTGCRDAVVWGRGERQLDGYVAAVADLGFRVETSRDAAATAAAASLIVTTTAAEAPLFPAAAVRPGTHVTAVGSDTAAKQELDPELLARADRVVADSLEQCRERGEIFQARKAGLLEEEKLVELGAVVAGAAPGRVRPEDVTVADLTGVAVQDVEIARATFEALEGEASS